MGGAQGGLWRGRAAPRAGERVAIDYIMYRRVGTKMHSTVEAGVLFSFTLGDKKVIAGLEQAVGGGLGCPPMLPGSARRVIIPQTLGYGVEDGAWQTTVLDGIGPVPPDFQWVDQFGEKVDSYLRFKNIYQNPNRIDQPDLVFDLKLRVQKPTAIQNAPTCDEDATEQKTMAPLAT